MKTKLSYFLLNRADNKYRKQFENCAFNERDDYDDYQSYFEKELGRKMLPQELKDGGFKEFNKQADKLLEACDYVAYQMRVGDNVSVAKAEAEFYSLL